MHLMRVVAGWSPHYSHTMSDPVVVIEKDTRTELEYHHVRRSCTQCAGRFEATGSERVSRHTRWYASPELAFPCKHSTVYVPTYDLRVRYLPRRR